MSPGILAVFILGPLFWKKRPTAAPSSGRWRPSRLPCGWWRPRWSDSTLFVELFSAGGCFMPTCCGRCGVGVPGRGRWSKASRYRADATDFLHGGRYLVLAMSISLLGFFAQPVRPIRGGSWSSPCRLSMTSRTSALPGCRRSGRPLGLDVPMRRRIGDGVETAEHPSLEGGRMRTWSLPITSNASSGQHHHPAL